MYDEASHQLMALLDWELASFGPPEMDLAWYLELDQLTVYHAGTTPPGFRDRDELFRVYSQSTKHEIDNMAWHGVFAFGVFGRVERPARTRCRTYRRVLSGELRRRQSAAHGRRVADRTIEGLRSTA